VYANLRAGNLKECSFGFYVNGPDGESWDRQADGSMLRTLLDVNLFDVSVVVNPAYSGTSAAARNIVPDDLEARMAGANLVADRDARAARVKALINEHNAWEQQRVADELAAMDAERSKAQARLAEAKATL
jgi:hypothetical protein